MIEYEVVGFLPNDWTIEQFNALLELGQEKYPHITAGAHRIELERDGEGYSFIVSAMVDRGRARG